MTPSPGTRGGRTAHAADDAVGYVDRLWIPVITGDEHTATGIVLDAVDDGLDDETVLLDVIGAVQRRVGQEWAANRLSVAEEHTASAINERVIGALRRHSSAAGRISADRARIVVTCVDGEWHALPARLVSEVLTRRGFRVDYLGAQVPVAHLVEHLHRTGPDAVALSGSIATRLPAAHATITASTATGVPVIAGGGAFGVDGHYARLLGARAWAADARGAADQLDAGLPPPGRGPEPGDVLPHLDDQEYTMVSRSRAALTRVVLTGLDERLPGVRDDVGAQCQPATENLHDLVDFLATALYLDDDELFTSFVTWTAEVVAARGVPAEVLFPALRSLGTQLREFPRATRIVDAADACLRRHVRTSMSSESA